MASSRSSKPSADHSPRVGIERRGARSSTLANDAYHFLRTASWKRILALFVGTFLLANLVFSTVLYAGGARISNARGIVDDFWFSVQTMSTIGYGSLSPADHLANTVVTVESMFGILLVALVTGLFFARFSTPSARVLFSKVALITHHDRQRALLFRMANERATAIVEVTVRAYLTREEVLDDGEIMRRVYDLPLRRATSPVFALSFLAAHVIDERSPLYGVTAEQLRASSANVIVTFTGIDDRLAATVHGRHMYQTDAILFDRRFVDLFQRDSETGRLYLDLAPIHDTVPLPAAAAAVTPSRGDPGAAG